MTLESRLTGQIIVPSCATLVLVLFAVSSIARTPENAPSHSSHESIVTDLSDYVWPTDAGNIGTSTFGEFRRTHFHGGIDISTENTTGYRVFSVRDGYIARIRVSPIGYGKMLYVRHADGYYSTYAHLSHFNAEIDALVLRQQIKQGSFLLDLWCTPDELPVKKGEVIAYTGDTGIGTPHLHFEIRDENLEPINPLLCTEFSFPDNIAPTAKRIAISPLDEHSTVDGMSSARIFPLRHVGGHHYKLAETVRVTGTVGFAIAVTDLSNGARFKHGVYGNKLYIDDKLEYTVQLDRVPGRDAHEIGLYYDWNLLDQGRGRFEKLYMDSPSTLVFYAPRKPGAGAVNAAEVAEGPHTFRIVSTDFNNNSSEVTGSFLLDHPPHFELGQGNNELSLTFSDIKEVEKVLVYSRRNGSEDWNLKSMTPIPYAEGNVIRIPEAGRQFDVVKVVAQNIHGTRSHPQFLFVHKPSGPADNITLDHDVCSDFVRVSLRSHHPFTEPPRLIVYEGASRRTINLTATDIGSYAGSFKPLESFSGTRRLVADAEINGVKVSAVDEFDIYPIVPGRSGTINADGGKLVVSFDSSSVFKTVFMQVEERDGHDLEYTLLPENTVLKGGLRVAVQIQQPQSNQGLFFSGLGGWEMLDYSLDDTKKVLSGTITRTLGEISVRVDDTPPNISRLSISRTSSGRPVISFRYGDNFSGVEYKELKMYIDGVAVIPEVDGERHKATYKATRPLERGPHQLTVRIKDRMENGSVVERQFSVR